MQTLQPAHQRAGMRKRIVALSEKRVFDGDPVAGRLLIAVQRRKKLFQRIGRIAGNEFVAQFVVHGVQGDRQTDAEPGYGQCLDAGDDPGGRHRHMPNAQPAHSGSVQNANRAEQRVAIQERLPHPHENEIVDLPPDVFFHRDELCRNLAPRKIALESAGARKAERATDGAARLRRQAGRQAVALFQQRRLDLHTVLHLY